MSNFTQDVYTWLIYCYGISTVVFVFSVVISMYLLAESNEKFSVVDFILKPMCVVYGVGVLVFIVVLPILWLTNYIFS